MSRQTCRLVARVACRGAIPCCNFLVREARVGGSRRSRLQVMISMTRLKRRLPPGLTRTRRLWPEEWSMGAVAA